MLVVPELLIISVARDSSDMRQLTSIAVVAMASQAQAMS